LRRSCPTACVTCVWAGVDSVWEQKKLEARKKPVKRGDSHLSGARIVSPLFVLVSFDVWLNPFA